MELQGKIYAIKETQVISDTFSKREFIIETDEQYKNYISLEMFKEKCNVLNGYNVGDEVKCSLNLKGRIWVNPQGEEKAFNTLECWRIEKNESATPPASAIPPITPTDAFEPAYSPQDEEESDLPF